LREYPFHGPVIVEFDQQKIGIRYVVFQSLLGGQ
jgi:ferrous iron transport protein A